MLDGELPSGLACGSFWLSRGARFNPFVTANGLSGEGPPFLGCIHSRSCLVSLVRPTDRSFSREWGLMVGFALAVSLSEKAGVL